MNAILVSHTHWDREWYRPFEQFRARLVDTIDLVLDQLDADPGWAFLLDGQTVVIEDYLEVRPRRRADLQRHCQAGRLAIGPWYVQPDSLLPSGEAHVRNLLQGRLVGETVGPVSTVGYTPDSFGHPAQMPQLFNGFGIDSFVYWRGNGAERIDPVWRWVAPDGSSVTAVLMAEGYFSAAYLGSDPEHAARRLENMIGKLAHPSSAEVLLMNGIDHAPPDTITGEVAALVDGLRRGLLEDHLATLAPPTSTYSGELVGGRITNLLQGVWSTRMYLKQRNRAAQSELEGWAEPWAAWARVLGYEDERPSLTTAWRALLVNQAHDSLCGCSTDQVHRDMLGRYSTAEGLARETSNRVLERIAGLGPRRYAAWRDGMEVAVFNPSPHPRTDVVRMRIDGHPVFMIGSPEDEIHPLIMASVVHQGMTVDGKPARIVAGGDDRVRMVPEQEAWDAEWIAEDVPAMGWRRYRLAPGPRAETVTDGGDTITVGAMGVTAERDGTLTVTSSGQAWGGLCGLDFIGDRGDSYDFDPDPRPWSVVREAPQRTIHPTGTQELTVTSTILSRGQQIALVITASLHPGVDRVDLRVVVDNDATDHRLRLLFPLGGDGALTASTFDAVWRDSTRPDDSGWVQPAPTTFVHQGWVAGGGITVGAPDLPEAELVDGTLAITLLRAVGWLSRMDLKTRPLPAGPGMPAPEAQCHGRFETRLHVWCGPAARRDAPRDAELGLRAVAAGDREPISLLTLAPQTLQLSAVKPAERTEEIIVRVLNPTDEPTTATLTFGVAPKAARPVRLDEEPAEEEMTVEGERVTFPVGAHALRSVAVTF